ncbi:type VII secretion protein EssC, partial [Enterococcus plantarum]|uniref:type VII secretion protein EssC n=1 Tax=Enterococcus plantarum TaxID=1077675 RepID=UPI001A8F3A8C
YQKLYKNGDVSEPMPHLFLISDEFAELKSEQPEFMKELVSTARIGRSLGIHLILATQKPSGVVNDQIWSNSKFKLALKVADKADSMEMLKTPDAAEITQAGRAYLQVGNNEIYELFQSAWSGADYQPEKDDQQIEDHTIYLVNDLGQYEILSEDLSGLENADDVKQIPTELDAIIDGIHEVAERENITPLPRPWLPPLEERIASSTLHPVDFREEWLTEKQPLEPVLGVVDVPSMQAQNTLRLNMTQEGHMTVFSSPGYGKSTFMQTVVMDLARVHSPERLNVYLLDFGTNGLLPLKKLPHVADTMSIDEEEKIEKFARRINDELKRRKKLLSEFSVASLDMYERASGKEEPIILILLDGFEGLKDAKFNEILEKVITQVAREGAGIGVHLLLSAGRQNSLKAILSSNIKTQIVLKMIDDSEPRAIVGRTTLTIDDLPGRGLIKLDEPELFQAALPADGEEALQIIEAIQEEVAQMDKHWTGARPEPIPMVPEELTYEHFAGILDRKHPASTEYIPLGLDLDSVEVVPWLTTKEEHLTVVGASQQDTEGLMKLFITQINRMNQANPVNYLHVIDTSRQTYQHLSGSVVSYVSELEGMEQLLTGIRNEQVALKEQNRIDVEMNHYILIANINDFSAKTRDTLAKINIELYEEYDSIKFITFGSANDYGANYDDFSKLLKQNKYGLLFMKYSDQSLLTAANLNYKSPALTNQEAYFVEDDYATILKLPTIF